MFWRKKLRTKLAKAMIAKAKLAKAKLAKPKLAKAKASDNNKAYKITVWRSRSGVIYIYIYIHTCPPDPSPPRIASQVQQKKTVFCCFPEHAPVLKNAFRLSLRRGRSGGCKRMR